MLLLIKKKGSPILKCLFVYFIENKTAVKYSCVFLIPFIRDLMQLNILHLLLALHYFRHYIQISLHNKGFTAKNTFTTILSNFVYVENKEF